MEWIKTYWDQHGWVGVLAAWTVLSSVLNLLLSVKPADYWVELAKTSPKAAGAVKALRAAGIDPFAAIKALQVYFVEAKKDTSS